MIDRPETSNHNPLRRDAEVRLCDLWRRFRDGGTNVDFAEFRAAMDEYAGLAWQERMRRVDA